MWSCDHKTRQLVVLAKDGDRSAVNQLCSVYAERVRWMVHFRMSKELRSKFESMDLVQNILINVFNRLDKFTYKNEGDFVRWLSKIAENELQANIRKLHAEKRDIRKEVSLHLDNPTTASDYILDNIPQKATTPSLIMSRREELEKLARAMDELKSEYREVIILAKIEGLSYQQIAGKLNKSNEAVRKLVSRAMAELAVTIRGYNARSN